MTSTDREQVFRVVFRDSGFFFHGVSHVIDSVVELGRVVVDVQYINNDCRRVGVFIVEHTIRQLVALCIPLIN